MKENEWIVSPKQLRENQERAFEEEAKIKQSKHDKKALIIIGIVCVGLLIYMTTLVFNTSKKFMINCTNAGNSVEFCRANI